MLAEFRARNVTVQRMRPAIVKLRDEFGRYPLAHSRPFLDVDGRELVRVVQEDVGLERQLQLVVVRDGQLLLTPAAERFRSAVEYDGPVAGLLRPDLRTPDVVMDRLRAISVRSRSMGPRVWSRGLDFDVSRQLGRDPGTSSCSRPHAQTPPADRECQRAVRRTSAGRGLTARDAVDLQSGGPVSWGSEAS